MYRQDLQYCVSLRQPCWNTSICSIMWHSGSHVGMIQISVLPTQTSMYDQQKFIAAHIVIKVFWQAQCFVSSEALSLSKLPSQHFKSHGSLESYERVTLRTPWSNCYRNILSRPRHMQCIKRVDSGHLGGILSWCQMRMCLWEQVFLSPWRKFSPIRKLFLNWKCFPDC